MLLLPTTLMSVAIGAAMLPAPGLDEAVPQLPTAALVDGIGYLTEVRGLSLRDCQLAFECGQIDESQGSVPDGQSPELPADDDAIAGSFGPAADPDSLDGMRGGDGNGGSSIIMNGTVADNRATNVITGTNMITEGSFANASGVPMVVQNTGANVLIQNATVINLQLR